MKEKQNQSKGNDLRTSMHQIIVNYNRMRAAKPNERVTITAPQGAAETAAALKAYSEKVQEALKQ